jgi:predicted PurR-regulated permease PerM
MITEGRAVDFSVYRRLLLWIVGISLVLLFLWFAWDVVLVIFAGVLVATVLSAATDWLKEKADLSRGAAFAIVVVSITVVVAGSVWALAPQVISQSAEIARVLPQAVQRMRDGMNQYESGRFVTALLERAAGNMDVADKLGQLATAAVEVIAALIVVVVVGFFVALEPGIYVRGVLALFPNQYRGRVNRILSEVGYQLKWWMLGQMFPMVVLGVGTMLGLWLMGVPLAFTLGLFTGVMIFIPYLGSLISGIPAALVALMQGPMHMVWVMVMFTGVHLLEGYILAPIAQKRAVRLPPALTITAQLTMWSLTGVLGVAVATPLAAAAVVVIKLLYLHEQPEY